MVGPRQVDRAPSRWAGPALPPPLRGRARVGGGPDGAAEVAPASTLSSSGERPPTLALPLGGGRGLKCGAATGLALFALALTGCAAGQKVHSAYADAQTATLGAVGLAPKPEPVTQVLCFWQQRLGTLSNPAADGEQVAGLVGQLFFVGPRSPNAEAAGSVDFWVTDLTPRPAGVEARPKEVFHFDRATVAKLKTKDDRFGECHAFFLPWPKEWGASVTQVSIVAAYFPEDKAGGVEKIQAPETKLTLDFAAPGTPTWTKTGEGAAPGAPPTLQGGGVRDPRKILAQIQAQGSAPPLTSPVAPAGASLPAAPPVPPAPPPVTAPRLAPQLPPTAPLSLSPTSSVGAYQPASGEPIAPKNTANSRYATEGAWAGPAPAVRPELGPNAPVVEGPAKAMILPGR